MDREYEAEDDARTLSRAHEIVDDGKRLKGIHRHLSKRLSSTKMMMKRLHK